MEITPDPNAYGGDGYDEDTILYHEKVYENWYFYELYVLIDDKSAAIVITDNGVSVDFKSGECTRTNITPKKLFPDSKSLSWKQISKILKVLKNTGIEGKLYSKDEMDALYQEWKSLGEP